MNCFNDEFFTKSLEELSEETENIIIEDNGPKEPCDLIERKSVYEATFIAKIAIQKVCFN